VFTGFRDDSLEAAIVKQGGAIAKSFTKAVTMVIAFDPADNTGKLKKAKASGIICLGSDRAHALAAGTDVSGSAGVMSSLPSTE
jgi:NAD-dependent DNA ligase